MIRRVGQNLPDEGPSEDDLERFSGRTRPCPRCNAELYDDVELCWKCGQALSEPSRRHAPWVTVLVIVLIAAFAGVFTVVRLL